MNRTLQTTSHVIRISHAPFQLDTGIRFMQGYLHKQSLWIRDDSEVKNNITGSHGESHIPSP